MTTPIVVPPVDSDNLKRCSKCGEFKPLKMFRRASNTKDGRGAYCVPCAREYDHTHYIDNKETILENARAYREANREVRREKERVRYAERHSEILARKRAWYAANSEKEKARHRRYYDANIDRVREYSAEYKRNYYAANRERLLEDNRKWRKSEQGIAYYETNAERRREQHRKNCITPSGRDSRMASKHRRRKREADSSSPITSADIRSIRAAQTDRKGRLICWRCHKPITGTPHLDHFVPLDKGGANNAGNLHFMHAKCNLSKSNKHPHELGMLI